MWTVANPIKHPIPPLNPTPTDIIEKSLLFSPIQYQNLSLKQRTWVPAMVPWRSNLKGEVTKEVIAWYRRFAKGKPGAIVIEATGIREIESGPLLRISNDSYLDGLSRLVEAVKESSEGETQIFIQLIDFLQIKRRIEASQFLERFLVLDPLSVQRLAQVTEDDSVYLESSKALSQRLIALSMQSDGEDKLREILSPRQYRDLYWGYREEINDEHLSHIQSLPQMLPALFCQAGLRAKKAGFDGIELHYAHAYTMASFLSATNQRKDGYGGSLENRLKLPLEVYHALRTEVGAYPLGCRFLADEIIPGGTSVIESSRFAQAFAQAGMDFLSISRGGKFDDAMKPKVGQSAYPYTGQSGYECMPTVYSDQRGPFGRNLDAVKEIKAALWAQNAPYSKIPVIYAGGIRSFEQAEHILENQHADIIASARQSLADPDWWLKIKQGRADQVRQCQFTNYCEALDQHHKQVTCRLWDRLDLGDTQINLSLDGKRRLEAP
jgi:2,4-dienoyl-CoA reductase-like NADH-dependent reductase (Old Yellow Enzyme family)